MDVWCRILVLACLTASPARAQLSFHLPEVSGVYPYVEPLVVWLPGGIQGATQVGYGLGIETSFEVAGPSTEPSPPCHGEGAGSPAWCDVNLELAVGYGQAGSYGRSPLFLLPGPAGTLHEVSAVIHDAPSIGLYLNFPGGRWAPYVGGSLSLAFLSGQVTLPGQTELGGPATFSMSAMTMAPGLRVGALLGGWLFAEVGGEWRTFSAVEYRSSPNVAVPPSAPFAFDAHSLQLRLGVYLRVPDTEGSQQQARLLP